MSYPTTCRPPPPPPPSHSLWRQRQVLTSPTDPLQSPIPCEDSAGQSYWHSVTPSAFCYRESMVPPGGWEEGLNHNYFIQTRASVHVTPLVPVQPTLISPKHFPTDTTHLGSPGHVVYSSQQIGDDLMDVDSLLTTQLVASPLQEVLHDVQHLTQRVCCCIAHHLQP